MENETKARFCPLSYHRYTDKNGEMIVDTIRCNDECAWHTTQPMEGDHACGLLNVLGGIAEQVYHIDCHIGGR